MEESDTEGVAHHGGPEPCVGVGEDGGEALVRGTCRQGYGAAKSAFRGADAVRMSGRQHR